MTEPTTDALPDTLHAFDGPGGLPMIDIRNAHATARVSLHGAQVLAFQPRGDRELLFLSERAFYQQGKAIRGGVPVCWPWFGLLHAHHQCARGGDPGRLQVHHRAGVGREL